MRMHRAQGGSVHKVGRTSNHVTKFLNFLDFKIFLYIFQF